MMMMMMMEDSNLHNDKTTDFITAWGISWSVK
jgi:hypothetical protein